MEKLKKILNQGDIVFFGGAGVSTESGIPDFRSVDGLYNEKYDYPPEEILSHTFFQDLQFLCREILAQQPLDLAPKRPEVHIRVHGMDHIVFRVLRCFAGQAHFLALGPQAQLPQNRAGACIAGLGKAQPIGGLGGVSTVL